MIQILLYQNQYLKLLVGFLTISLTTVNIGNKMCCLKGGHSMWVANYIVRTAVLLIGWSRQQNYRNCIPKDRIISTDHYSSTKAIMKYFQITVGSSRYRHAYFTCTVHWCSTLAGGFISSLDKTCLTCVVKTRHW